MGQRKVNGWRMRWEVSNVPWVQLCVQPQNESGIMGIMRKEKVVGNISRR